MGKLRSYGQKEKIKTIADYCNESVLDKAKELVDIHKPESREELDNLLSTNKLTNLPKRIYGEIYSYWYQTIRLGWSNRTKPIDSNKEEGIKHDDGKLQWSLLELKNLEPMLKVLMFGANKYAPDNWKKVPDAKKRYYDAFMRHCVAYQEGELIDEESGLPHLAHAQCCLYFLSYFEQKDTL